MNYLDNINVETTKVMNVIITSEKRGLGVKGDPIRRIAQLYTLDGELICEADDEYLQTNK